MTWSQNYAPLGSVGVSALIAALPVVTLLGMLAIWRVRAQFAALAGLLVAATIAMIVYHMPAQLTLAAAIYGGAFGLFPIGWITSQCHLHLQFERGDRAIRHPAKTIVRRVARPADSGAADRVQLWRVHRRRGGIWRARGHHRRPVDRTRFPSARSGEAGAHRQHRARRVRIAGHTDHHAGQSHRTRRATVECDGGPPTRSDFRHHPVLAGCGASRLARHDGRVAGLPRDRRDVRPDAISRQQFSRPVARGNRQRVGFHDFARGVHENLAAGRGTNLFRAKPSLRNNRRPARKPRRGRRGCRGCFSPCVFFFLGCQPSKIF